MSTRLIRVASAAVAVLACQIAAAPPAAAQAFCTQTATSLQTACRYEVLDDYYVARAKCVNLMEDVERNRCFAAANQERLDGNDTCADQFATRTDACKLLGEARYDPEIEPVDFDSNFVSPSVNNPYFPLKVGNKWTYKGGGEVNTIEILNQTKLIDEITCVVARDRVFVDGRLHEDTDDWYAQGRNGDIFYCGEEVKNYESFPGDRPQRPELVGVDGSFKHDRDNDFGGLIMPGRPVKGLTYRQEASLGNAEDVAQVVSANYRFGVDAALDRLVPAALANMVCGAGDCVVTKEWSLLEPGIFAYKYFARGVGFFLETKPDSGEVLQLTGCNVDARCTTLPQPR